MHKQASKNTFKVGQSEYEIKNSDASITPESSTHTHTEKASRGLKSSGLQRVREPLAEVSGLLFIPERRSASAEISGQCEQMACILLAYSPALSWLNTTRHGRCEGSDVMPVGNMRESCDLTNENTIHYCFSW